MDPATLAMMYAANVGINALGGKRGSNLWKDSFKDTTTQALTMQLTGGFDKGKTPMIGQDNMTLSIDDTIKLDPSKKPKIPEGLTAAEEIRFKNLRLLDPSQKSISVTNQDPGWFDKITGVFKSEQPIMGKEGAQFETVRDMEGNLRQVPITMAQTDKMKVGLGSLGAGAAAYGLGLFDPEPPEDPKYPGYNKFYAQDPSQFMPYDDPNIAPIDYSKYPDKPYSGIKTGGIIGLQDGGPASYKNILQTEYGYERDYLDNLEINEGPGAVKELYDSLQGKKGGGVMKLTGGGQTSMNLDHWAQLIFNKPYNQLTPAQQQQLTSFAPEKAQGGIMKLVRGGKASNEPVKSPSEYDDMGDAGREELERRRKFGDQMKESTPREPSMPQQPMPGSPRETGPKAPGGQMTPKEWRKKLQEQLEYMNSIAVKSGDLVHKLPHKTKQNENNPKNYKRTSGKLVVDDKGKGNEEKDTMLAQLADGEFVTKSKAVRGAGIALGANPKNKKQQRDLGAKFFYKQMAEFDKLAKRMAS